MRPRRKDTVSATKTDSPTNARMVLLSEDVACALVAVACTRYATFLCASTTQHTEAQGRPSSDPDGADTPHKASQRRIRAQRAREQQSTASGGARAHLFSVAKTTGVKSCVRMVTVGTRPSGSTAADRETQRDTLPISAGEAKQRFEEMGRREGGTTDSDKAAAQSADAEGTRDEASRWQRVAAVARVLVFLTGDIVIEIRQRAVIAVGVCNSHTQAETGA